MFSMNDAVVYSWLLPTNDYKNLGPSLSAFSLSVSESSDMAIARRPLTLLLKVGNLSITKSYDM